MALPPPGAGTALCCGTDLRVDATASPGIRARRQYQLLVLLRADGHACPASAGWAGRHGARGGEIAQRHAAQKHAGRDFAVLAFHGCAVGVSAFAALDEALNIAPNIVPNIVPNNGRFQPGQRWGET